MKSNDISEAISQLYSKVASSDPGENGDRCVQCGNYTSDGFSKQKSYYCAACLQTQIDGVGETMKELSKQFWGSSPELSEDEGSNAPVFTLIPRPASADSLFPDMSSILCPCKSFVHPIYIIILMFF